MITAIVTSVHPNYPHVYTTLYKGLRYDVNTKTDCVTYKGANQMGSYSIAIHNTTIKNVVTTAVHDYIKTKE